MGQTFWLWVIGWLWVGGFGVGLVGSGVEVRAEGGQIGGRIS